MGVEVHQLGNEVVGRRLGQNLYNPAGNLLLRKGVEITPRYLDYFQDSGYQSIFLLSQGVSSEGSRFNSDRLLTTAPYILKKVFRKMRIDDTVRAAQAKGDLLSLAEAILVHVQNRLEKPPQLLELKRQGDYLYQHCVNVAVYSIFIGRAKNYSDQQLLNLAIAGLIHDFGMEFVDGDIVNKKDELGAEEFEQVKQHTTKGFTHLVHNCAFDGITTVASVQHHERFDGTGYPKRLHGNSIHEFSRIITLTDFFDAWTSDRPHRRMHSLSDAVAYIQEEQGSIFDPALAQSFTRLFT